MGVLIQSGSALMGTGRAETGVAVLAEVISEGKLEVRGVASFSSLGFVADGMLVGDGERRVGRGSESCRGRRCECVAGDNTRRL